MTNSLTDRLTMPRPKITKLEKEIRSALGIKRDPDMSAAEWKGTIVRAYDQADQEIVDSLSDDAFDWLQDLLDAVEGDSELPPWPSEEDEQEVGEDPVEDADELAEAPEKDSESSSEDPMFDDESPAYEGEDDDEAEYDEDDDEDEYDEDDGEVDIDIELLDEPKIKVVESGKIKMQAKRHQGKTRRTPKRQTKIADSTGEVLSQQKVLVRLLVQNLDLARENKSAFCAMARDKGITLSQSSMNTTIYQGTCFAEAIEKVSGKDFNQLLEQEAPAKKSKGRKARVS